MSFSKILSMIGEYHITMQVYYGGIFLGETEYIGGNVYVNEKFDINDFSFSYILDIVQNLGCNSLQKGAFKVKDSAELCFFDDVDSFGKNMISCIDWENKVLKVYVESQRDQMDVEYDSHFGIDDGLEEANFSSEDEEFLQAREILRTEKGKIDEADATINPLMELDFASDDGCISIYESSDDSVCSLDVGDDVESFKHKRDKNLVYAKNCDHKNLNLQIGMKFRDVKKCQDAVKLWAMLNGYNIRWTKSSHGKLQARCEGQCPWMMYASRLTREPTCVIKTYVSSHTCVRAVRNRQVTATWLADSLMKDVETISDLKAKDIEKQVRLKYGVTINPMKCYRAKWTAEKNLIGTVESHYSKIRSYFASLKKMDREGRFELKTYLDSDNKPIFQRAYIGFSSLRKGLFIGYRKFIGFDACFLKTALGGVLLAAVTKDCNLKMYPIAWAVVEKENEECWFWFFEKLFDELNIEDGFGWTFMSDKQKGLINAVRRLAPNVEHRHCARHIYANWKKKHAGPKFHELFWDVVRSASEAQFKYNMEQLKAESNDAYDDFYNQQPKGFCKSLINPHTKTDIVENNICETFNSYILRFRDKFLIHMLEGIRKSLMTRMYDLSKSTMVGDDILCPNIRNKLEKNRKNVRFCELHPAIGGKFEVYLFKESYIVDLVGKSCTCRAWGLTDIPCCHALACIEHSRDNFINYVDEFYYKINWQECYKFGLTPHFGTLEWPEDKEPPVFPPAYVTRPGRPKKERKRANDELKTHSNTSLGRKGVKMSCRKCGGLGHNARTCKEESRLDHSNTGKRLGAKRLNSNTPTQISSGSKPRGRPRKDGTSDPVDVIERREKRLTKQGYGARMFADSGNVWMRNPGGKVVQLVSGASSVSNLRNSSQIGERSSQSSQVTNGVTPPPSS